MEIIYDTDEKLLTPRPDETLLELCLRSNIALSHSCEAMGTCGTCRVIITSDVNKLPARNAIEQSVADDRDFAPEERLACQTQLKQNLSFRIPGDS